MGFAPAGAGPLDVVKVGGSQRTTFGTVAIPAPFGVWQEVITETALRLQSMCDWQLVNATVGLFWAISKDGVDADAVITPGAPHAFLDGLYVRQQGNLWVFNGHAAGAHMTFNYDPIFPQNIQ